MSTLMRYTLRHLTNNFQIGYTWEIATLHIISMTLIMVMLVPGLVAGGNTFPVGKIAIYEHRKQENFQNPGAYAPIAPIRTPMIGSDGNNDESGRMHEKPNNLFSFHVLLFSKANVGSPV